VEFSSHILLLWREIQWHHVRQGLQSDLFRSGFVPAVLCLCISGDRHACYSSSSELLWFVQDNNILWKERNVKFCSVQFSLLLFCFIRFANFQFKWSKRYVISELLISCWSGGMGWAQCALQSCWSVDGADTWSEHNVLGEFLISRWRGYVGCVWYTCRTVDRLVAWTHRVYIIYLQSWWSVVFVFWQTPLFIHFISVDSLVASWLKDGYYIWHFLRSFASSRISLASHTICRSRIVLYCIYTFQSVCSCTAVVSAWMWLCVVCWIVSCPKLSSYQPLWYPVNWPSVACRSGFENLSSNS